MISIRLLARLLAMLQLPYIASSPWCLLHGPIFPSYLDLTPALHHLHTVQRFFRVTLAPLPSHPISYHFQGSKERLNINPMLLGLDRDVYYQLDILIGLREKSGRSIWRSI